MRNLPAWAGRMFQPNTERDTTPLQPTANTTTLLHPLGDTQPVKPLEPSVSQNHRTDITVISTTDGGDRQIGKHRSRQGSCLSHGRIFSNPQHPGIH